ncbi:RagB/SusD family nutrient uptake outer membrane protein [Spirosoma flavus]
MKTIHKNVTLALVLVSLASCRDVTTQLNPSGITATNFYRNGADADVAINSCYDAFQNPSQYVLWGDGRADLLAVTDRSTNNDIQLVNGNLNATNPYIGWDNMYEAIKRTNSVLKNVPTIADPGFAGRKERVLGEAYFLRAMAYFYLVRTFDNVPLILEPYESLTQDFFPKQATPEQVFAQVETDLKAAESRLPNQPFSSLVEQKGKASLGAVRAALTDLYLWQKKYQQAADAAQQVISSPNGYALVSGANFGTIFNRNSSESIWEVQFNNAYLESNNTNNLVNLFVPLGGTGYAGGNWSFTYTPKLLNAYVSGDLRGPATVRNTGTPNSTSFRDANTAYINKYLGTLANGNAIRYFDANQVIYRLADVILMRAEALNELGKTTDAIPLLNQIRTRAGVSVTNASSQADVRLAIENERFLELAFEGKRYYDLKRTGRYAAVTGKNDPNWLRWPISSTEITKNPNLVQNPGY